MSPKFKKILLIDADSTIPNIPLMKLSTYHKKRGDRVKLVRLNLPYFPFRKKKTFRVLPKSDIIYCSVVFEGNKQHILGNNIIFGGTGVDLKTHLSPEIEKLPCDYSLYPENDTSYGFITRGCIRNCWFCKVPKKEGMIHQVAEIKDIVQHKKVKFLDNNILAFPNHTKILRELIRMHIKCEFNQGLDIRLVNKGNSILLSKLNYMGSYVFAFDNLKDKPILEEKISLLEWRREWGLKFFVYVHPKMSFSNIITRILWLKEHKCLTYLMRDISCWDSENKEFYTDLAAYCNQIHLYKKMKFTEFLEKRNWRNPERIKKHKKIWEETTNVKN
jgi:hypothetical protein